MKLLSLICTVHVESGLANSAELYKRLKRFGPEVIFLEAPVEDIDSFFQENGRPKLEASPARQYRDLTGAALIPVDLPTPPEKFFRDHAALMQQIENKSGDHRRLMTWHSNYIADYGFPYLNSEHCCTMYSEIEADIESTVTKIGSPRISAYLDAWNTTKSLREHEMLNNISRHCANLSFERGAFIIGAAHRRSIIEKARSLLGIQWNFSDIRASS